MHILGRKEVGRTLSRLKPCRMRYSHPVVWQSHNIACPLSSVQKLKNMALLVLCGIIRDLTVCIIDSEIVFCWVELAINLGKSRAGRGPVHDIH